MKPLTPRAKVAALALLVAYGTSDGQVLGGSATGPENVAIGKFSKASGDLSTALGDASKAIGESSTALGMGSEATGEASTALGLGSEAIGMRSTALGVVSRATGSGSIALGMGSEATEADTVSVGSGNDRLYNPKTRRIVNVTAGKNATDAVNKAQLDALMASVGKLLARIEALEAKLASN